MKKLVCWREGFSRYMLVVGLRETSENLGKCRLAEFIAFGGHRTLNLLGEVDEMLVSLPLPDTEVIDLDEVPAHRLEVVQ